MELKILNTLFAICILVRLSLAFFIKNLKGTWLKISSFIGFFIGFGFLKMILINRTDGAFGQKVWWGDYRIIHAILYFMFGILAFNKHQLSYLPILIDTILGLIFYINNHY